MEEKSPRRRGVTDPDGPARLILLAAAGTVLAVGLMFVIGAAVPELGAFYLEWAKEVAAWAAKDLQSWG